MAGATKAELATELRALRKSLAREKARVARLEKSSAEARLTAERHELAMRGISEGVYDWDIAKGTVYYSDRVYHAVGLTRKHFSTVRDWRNRIHPEDLPAFDAALTAHLKGETERFECDYRFRGRNGVWRWARQHGIATRDARGRAVRLTGSTGDISELKRVEQALAESQERYALATQAATEGIYEWNLATGSLYLSDRAKAFFAVKGKRLTPAAWNARVHREDFRGYRDAIAAYFGGRTAQFEHEYRIRNSAGGWYWVVDRAVAVRDASGRVVRMVGALADVTERKHAEIELRRALERQTASAEILKVIAGSPTDVRPVLDALAERVGRLCQAAYVNVLLADGNVLRTMAVYSGEGGPAPDLAFTMPALKTTVNGRAFVEKSAVQVEDFAAVAATEYPDAVEIQRRFGFRTILGVPMLRGGKAIGTISIWRLKVELFGAEEVSLIQTFADQAVIAIENVRLLKETQERLSQQTATAEVLKLISRTTFDLDTVLRTLVTSAAELCQAQHAVFYRMSDDGLRPEAWHNVNDEYIAYRKRHPVPISPRQVMGRVALTRQPVHVLDVLADPDYLAPAAQTLGDYRTVLGVPVIREGELIGTLAVFRSEVRPFLDSQAKLLATYADQAVIAIENVRLFRELEARNSELTEALEQQTATAEVLRAISASPADLQPILDVLASAAARFCGAPDVVILRLDGTLLRAGAACGPFASALESRANVEIPLDRGSVTGRAVIERRLIHIPDLAAESEDEYPVGRELQRRLGHRAMAVAPLLRDGAPLGAIALFRTEPQPFSERQLALLRVFADQAVIAIENVRLFNETKEALEQQTASAEILRTIASAHTDAQPVFQAITDSALGLCNAAIGATFLFDGERVDIAAVAGFTPEAEAAYRSTFPLVPTRDNITARAVVDRKRVHVPDIEADDSFPVSARLRESLDFRSVLAVPMLRDRQCVGVITVARRAAGSFSDRQIALLETFADQAVIAIENVRLFNETKEALERQTATAEILKVISGSPTDVQPVFDAITRSAARLFDPCDATIAMLENGVLQWYSTSGLHHDRPAIERVRAVYPLPFDPERSPSSRAIQERRIVEIVDAAAPDAPEFTRRAGRAGGFRSACFVPLLREDEGMGAIILTHPQPGFKLSDKQLSLVQTFADQAVIAIENVRLFNETKEALERQTAISDILRVISSSPSDVGPVLEAVAERAARICEAKFVDIVLRDGETMRVGATFGELGRPLGEAVPLDRTTVMGRSIVDGAPVHVADPLEAGEEFPLGQQLARKYGHRTILAVPLVREARALGTILVRRTEVRRFEDKHVALLKTFADQAAIAIQNVRLFNETREALERQTATAEILKVISSSPTDTQPVFDKITESCERLFAGDLVGVTVVDAAGQIVLAAYHGPDETALRNVYPLPLSHDSGTGSAILEAEVKHYPDIEAPGVPAGVVAGCRALGNKAIVFAPLIAGGSGIGAIWVARVKAVAFSERDIALLKTFADQAVIAIQNARLFNETKEALERQTATAEILNVIASSPSDVQPVFDAIVDSAARLFGRKAALRTVENEGLRRRARSYDPAPGEFHGLDLEALDRSSIVGRAVLEGRALQYANTLVDGAAAYGLERAKSLAFRSIASAPLMLEGKAIGVISVSSPDPGELSDKQMALLSTFADQAVIAIQNVRLFNETKEALERQTATAEILKVIASSPSDVQPVFDAIAEAAMRLLGGHSAAVTRIIGDTVHLSAHTATDAAGSEALKTFYPRPLTSAGRIAEVVRSGKPAYIGDSESDPDISPESRELARIRGYRSMLWVPMLRDGVAFGTINVSRAEAGPFTDHQVDLLKTFADQAVIAIENVRLFNETKEALERQTATAEILKVISGSPTDVQPVFDAIVQSAARLFDCNSSIQMVDDGKIYLRAAAGPVITQGLLDDVLKYYPMVTDSNLLSARAIADGEIKELFDIEAPGVSPLMVTIGRTARFRSITVVPLLREGVGIGTITLNRAAPGKLDEKQRALLQTFAEQAVIAIENVRLFKELQARTEALTRSVGQLTALGEVSQAISSTLDLETVLMTIVQRAVQLTRLDGGSIYEYDERTEDFHLRATENVDEEYLAVLRRTPIRKGEGAVGRAALTGEPTQIPDIQDQSYQSRLRDAFIRAGYRAVLVVPLRREDHVIGALSVTRKTPGAFAPEVVELLKTFANQSAMAIQNARLFREIEEKGRQLETASRHKSDFLASMSHELRTPLNAILGFNEMILGEVYGDVPADMKEPLADIQTSGKHLLRLINNVLDLAKIEAGRMELALQDYSVHDTVESVRSTLRPLAAEKGLEFLASVPDDVPLAYGDAGRITQCLMNLAGNSLKFTKAGKVEIVVECRSELLIYKVADTGIGIPPEKIGSLFTEFKQSDATIAGEYGGTGLGLSISKKFVEMHGGRIWVESEPGRGSAFIFEVPLRFNEGATE